MGAFSFLLCPERKSFSYITLYNIHHGLKSVHHGLKSGFSFDRLYRYLHALDMDIEIIVKTFLPQAMTQQEYIFRCSGWLFSNTDF